MPKYSAQSRIVVRPFSHRLERDEVIIGDIDRQVFVAIPAEGLDILNWLAEGDEVGEVVRRFEQTHGEVPDIDEFLDALAAEGFISVDETAMATVPSTVHRFGRAEPARATSVLQAPATVATELAQQATPQPQPQPQPQTRSRRSRGLDVNWISPVVARRLISTPVLMCCGVVIVVGILLVVDQPRVFPTHEALLFLDGNFAALSWATTLLMMVSIGLHELGHALVARAAGVPARLLIGNLMYFLVFQTDVSGLWLSTKRYRMLGLLIGMIIDAASASFVIAVLWAHYSGIISLSQGVVLPLLTAWLFTYLMRIFLQFWFYLRTDMYYVVATSFNCKNLMADTVQFLRNCVAWLVLQRHRIVDQSSLPARERRVVQVYALVWIAGRFFAIGSLIFVFIPLFVSYFGEFFRLLTNGESRMTSVDFLTVLAFTVLFYGTGITMWVRELYRSARERRLAATTRPAAGPN